MTRPLGRVIFFLFAILLAPLAGRAQSVQMAQPEYNAYSAAMAQTDPAAKAGALEAYLSAYPQSQVKASVLETLLALSGGANPSRVLDTADRLLAVDPANFRALTYEAFLRKSNADAIADPAAKQSALDAAAAFARRGLAAPKPANVSDADFRTFQSSAYPTFYSILGMAALSRKDAPAAIDAYLKELAAVPLASTQQPGAPLQDTYYLATAYMQSAPPDLARCAYYAARAVAYAPEPFKTQMAPVAKYCYRKYHGSGDGYDSLAAVATANLNPPSSFYIKPAPTPAEIVHQVIASTPDLATLALTDKEFILQYGSPEDAAKVWQTIQGRSFEFPGSLVVDAKPGVLSLAISDDAIQSNTADLTVHLKPGAQPLGASKGSKVVLQATYDSFTSSPLMIFMRDGEVVPPTARPVHGYGAAQAPAPQPHPSSAAQPPPTSQSSPPVSSTPPVSTYASRRVASPAASPAPEAASPAPEAASPAPEAASPAPEAASSAPGVVAASTPTRAFTPEPQPQSAANAPPVPHNYALIFATNHYSTWPSLENPIPDADALAQTLQSLYGFQVEEAKDQTNAQIIQKLGEYLHRKFQPQDQLLIFFSGHGFFDPDLGQGFIVPANGARPQDDPGHLTLVAHDTIMRYVDNIPSQHVVLILDACFSGTLDRKVAESGLRGDPTMDIYTHATLSELVASKEPKRTRYYFASGGKDFVPDGLPGHHSPFMSALLVTLNQAADRKGYATLNDIQQGFETVKPEPRYGYIQDGNDPGADFLLLTPTAAAQVAKGN